MSRIWGHFSLSTGVQGEEGVTLKAARAPATSCVTPRDALAC